MTRFDGGVNSAPDPTSVGDRPHESGAPRKRKGKRPFIIGISLLVLVGLGAGGYLFMQNSQGGGSDADKISGKVALTASQLRGAVLANHLTAYWAGPVEGDKYALIATTTGSTFVRYLPGGKGLSDAATSYRVIATYATKDAFLITQSAGGVTGNVGFTNIDGNSVFYVKTRATNVYMGIKDKDIQLEIYDPGVDQALGLSLLHNAVQQIQ